MPYTAVVLDELSQKKLRNWFKFNIPPDHVWKGHHMTCDMEPASHSVAKEFVGKYVNLCAHRIGYGDGIYAVEVVCEVPSVNNRKHITICHRSDVKPKEANNITEWQEISPFMLYGDVKQVD